MQETGIPFNINDFMRGLLMIGQQLQPPDEQREDVPEVSVALISSVIINCSFLRFNV